MSPFSRVFAAALCLTAVAALPAQDKPLIQPPVASADGFKPLFNGKNLDGWVNVNCHPDTFVAKEGEIITTGTPTGFLRTDKQYENFVLEFDWMHVEKQKMANSGLFVWGDPLPAVGTPYTRGIEVQVLINFAPKDGWATSHGDIFSIHGAKCTPDRPHPKGIERCLPSENRVKGGGEWNHYKVTANDGAIKLEVNGKEVSGVSKCNPRKGYLALESEGAECHFKNIRIKELPGAGTGPKPEEVADLAKGHKNLFNGIDLKGWKTQDGAWRVSGGKLVSMVTGKFANEELLGQEKFGKCELIFDWKLPAKTEGGMQAKLGPYTAHVYPDGETLHSILEPDKLVGAPGKKVELKPGAWNRSVITFDGNKYAFTVNGVQVGAFRPDKVQAYGPVVFEPAAGTEIMNVFIRELEEDKVPQDKKDKKDKKKEKQ